MEKLREKLIHKDGVKRPYDAWRDKGVEPKERAEYQKSWNYVQDFDMGVLVEKIETGFGKAGFVVRVKPRMSVSTKDALIQVLQEGEDFLPLVLRKIEYTYWYTQNEEFEKILSGGVFHSEKINEIELL